MTDPATLPRLYIAAPCHGMVCPETAHSLFIMGLYLGLVPATSWVAYMRYSSSDLPGMRAWLAKDATEKGASHILWIDSDMGFPRDAAHRLLAHRLPIVGCNYTKRMPPYTPTAHDLDHKPIFTRQQSSGLEAAGLVGFGLLLTEVSVFAKLATPWFGQVDAEGYCTEDRVWSRRVVDSHQTIWVDHDLSKEVKHVGSVAISNFDAVEAAACPATA